ncbi:hypothetical protein VKT23_014742 [Stygiomarasmius scandens]|uniref:Uncharacterized protein n=1 Tax=Marasmiellus scandens TaxID=2682957 RepID=A0ABR1IZX5_9AGAR
MAAPAQVTMAKLSGKFAVNKSLSDSFDDMWRLQGAGWVARKAMNLAGLTLHINHHTDSSGIEHLDITPVVTGGMKASPDFRTLDYSEMQAENPMTGPMLVKTRKVSLSQVKDSEDEEMGKGKCDKEKNEKWLEDLVIHSHVKSTKKVWSNDEIWGFVEHKGQRRFVRLYHFIGPDKEVLNLRIVYDYVGPL